MGPNVSYQLLLTRHKGLKARCHTKPQLVDEGRLVLAVDLDLDARFIRGLICGYSRADTTGTQRHYGVHLRWEGRTGQRTHAGRAAARKLFGQVMWQG